MAGGSKQNNASDRLSEFGVVPIHSWEFVMKTFKSAVQAFIADEDGVTAIEYGLIAALIGVAMVTAATNLGHKISDAFVYVAGKLAVPAST
jgi:pilus assembly protein Flp/PilA